MTLNNVNMLHREAVLIYTLPAWMVLPSNPLPLQIKWIPDFSVDRTVQKVFCKCVLKAENFKTGLKLLVHAVILIKHPSKMFPVNLQSLIIFFLRLRAAKVSGYFPLKKNKKRKKINLLAARRNTQLTRLSLKFWQSVIKKRKFWTVKAMKMPVKSRFNYCNWKQTETRMIIDIFCLSHNTHNKSRDR